MRPGNTGTRPNSFTVTPYPVDIRSLFDGYTSNECEVTGFSGRLNIRPPYQRGLVYSPAAQAEVVDSILRGLPLGPIYWSVIRDEDGTMVPSASGASTYNLMDGQQRILSICEFLSDRLLVRNRTWTELSANDPDLEKRFLDTKLDIWVCDGPLLSMFTWFRIIKTGGVPLTGDELIASCEFFGS